VVITCRMLIRSDFVKVKVLSSWPNFGQRVKNFGMTKSGSVTAFLVEYLEFGASRKDFVKFSSKWGRSAAEPLYFIKTLLFFFFSSSSELTDLRFTIACI
jgi:hypothetical protein